MPEMHSSEHSLLLAKEEPLLAKALMLAANAIFITDAEGKIIWLNDALSRITGYSREELIGRTPAILQSGRQNRSLYNSLWKTILAGKVWQGEIIDRHKDGSEYTVDESITPLFDETGVITHFIAIQHDITQLSKEYKKAQYLAYHDSLTDLPNRINFLQIQQQAISHAKRNQHMFATLFLDLDKFKPINDTLGHHIGDQLIIAVGERLRKAVRQEDTVARFGGDEFAILLTELIDTEPVTMLAYKLRDILFEPFMLQGHKINVSVSIGIAIYPTDGEDPETLLINADKAMYHAKCGGGNRYQFYEEAFATSH